MKVIVHYSKYKELAINTNIIIVSFPMSTILIKVSSPPDKVT